MRRRDHAEELPSRLVLQSTTMLIRFHIILVAAGVLFCVGFALYLFIRSATTSVGADVALGAVFTALGLALSLYLRGVLRHGVRS